MNTVSTYDWCTYVPFLQRENKSANACLYRSVRDDLANEHVNTKIKERDRWSWSVIIPGIKACKPIRVLITTKFLSKYTSSMCTAWLEKKSFRRIFLITASACVDIETDTHMTPRFGTVVHHSHLQSRGNRDRRFPCNEKNSSPIDPRAAITNITHRKKKGDVANQHLGVVFKCT